MPDILKHLTAVTFVLAVVGCERSQPVRPKNVPLSAVAVSGSKTFWWQYCTVGDVDNLTRCQIWNAGGLVLFDEPFLPYDEKQLVTAKELNISSYPTFPGPDRVCLTNGRMLFPRSKFEKQKQFFDSLNRRLSTK